ncbi:MAG: hypothetical protein WD181_02460 [Solirubrobacterales bacterium]
MRFLRWLLVTVWFGIWALGPAYLFASGTIVDPRNIFGNFLSLVGCVMLVLGWLAVTIYFAVFDDLPSIFWS